VSVPWTDWMLGLRASNPEVAIVRGIENTIRALARLFPSAHQAVRSSPDDHAKATGSVLGEVEGRRVLGQLGLPLVRGEVCRTPNEALRAAERLHAPLVIKVDATGVAHKAAMGLVAIGCADDAAVAEALMRLEKRTRELMIEPESVAGYLVQEMAAGQELLIGWTRSDLGAFVTIGLGGVNAAAGTPARTLLLPADREVLRSSVASYLTSADLAKPGFEKAVDCINDICAYFATGVLSEYDVVEINPLMIAPDQVNIVDVLLVPGAALP
jgi:succinyl-CoA synthetase beta subunit